MSEVKLERISDKEIADMSVERGRGKRFKEIIRIGANTQLAADQKVLDAREAQHLKEKEEMIEAIESYSFSVNCVCGCWDDFKAKYLGK